MRIVFIGCVEFSYTMLKHLISSVPDAEIVGVVTRQTSQFNADFHSLEDIATVNGIPCFLAEGNNQVDIVEWIKKLEPDVVYCLGWSYLLGAELLEVARLGVVGYHPAALPRNRGRHPIIWALALGLNETASTFFFMDEGADSGDILSQKSVLIESSDDAARLYRKLVEVSIGQISEFTQLLSDGSCARTAQDHSKANYWRKRNKSDGQIDWRMSAESIRNLVRALARPYLGAHCVYTGREIKIWETKLLDANGLNNIEPGKVIKVEGTTVWVKCGEGALELISHEFPTIPAEGSYL